MSRFWKVGIVLGSVAVGALVIKGTLYVFHVDVTMIEAFIISALIELMTGHLKDDK